MPKSFVVAVDGPVASGKGTLAQRIAAHFHFAYLDTGSLYRAVGRKCLKGGNDPKDPTVAINAAKSLSADDLNDPHLRDEAVGEAASVVAANQDVRKTLLDYQRNYAINPPDGLAGAVLDGRDIGTVVCPDAPVKLFITASAEVRAHRRFLELQGKGVDAVEADVLGDLQKRDARDQQRTAAPLKSADDADIVNTDEMDRDAVFDASVAIIKSKM